MSRWSFRELIDFMGVYRGLDKPLPHPILDDPSKMMRVIGMHICIWMKRFIYFSFYFWIWLANPLYDKLTLSRAAQIRTPSRRSRERATNTPLKTTNVDKTIITVNHFASWNDLRKCEYRFLFKSLGKSTETNNTRPSTNASDRKSTRLNSSH